jgi:hypothetical protein
MSPHLLFLLTALRTHHPFTRERDRIDARLAATRMGVRRLMSRHATPDAGGPLPERG